MGDVLVIRLPLQSNSTSELTSKILEMRDKGYGEATGPLQEELERRFNEEGA